MKSFIGIGLGETNAAVAQATQGLGNPLAIIFFCSYTSLDTTSKLLHEKYPNASVMGTCGTSLANGKIDEKHLTVLGLFEDARVSMGIITDVSQCPISQIGKIENSINSVNADKDSSVCLEYCTTNEEMLVTTLMSVLEKKGISLAGGTVFGVPDGKPSLVAYNGNVYEDACVYAIIKNTTGKVRVFKENIYQKMSNAISHYATKVDEAKRGLIELDGRNAADVYCNEIGINRNQIIDNVLQNPMGRSVGDEVYISSMRELGSNGTIYNFKRVNKNDCMYFLELADYPAIERETRQTIKNSMRSISLIISIDCIYRYVLYSQENYIKTYASDMATLGPHIGVIGGGEQYNHQHVNQTMVCVVFE